MALILPLSNHQISALTASPSILLATTKAVKLAETMRDIKNRNTVSAPVSSPSIKTKKKDVELAEVKKDKKNLNTRDKLDKLAIYRKEVKDVEKSEKSKSFHRVYVTSKRISELAQPRHIQPKYSDRKATGNCSINQKNKITITKKRSETWPSNQFYLEFGHRIGLF